MERRLLLAIVLMIVVAVVPQLLLRQPPRPARGADATQVADSAVARPDSAAPVAATPIRPADAPPAAPTVTPASFHTVVLERPHTRMRFTTLGGALDQALYPDYKSFRAAGRPVNLVRPGDRLLAHRVVVGNDTVRLDSVAFTARVRPGGVTMTGSRGAVTLEAEYTVPAGRDYVVEVSGRIAGLEGRGGLLLVSLGTGFAQHEADSTDNYRYYGVTTRRNDIKETNFRDVPGGETRTLDGPFDWVAVKSKYFLAALLSPDSSRSLLSGAIMQAAPRPNRGPATVVQTWVTLPVGPDARFRYDLYVGPQEARTLHRMGRALDRAAQYGWIFRPIVMPVASWIARLLRWMHENMHLAYGWVLVLFGILVRVVLWPLNQRAMKSQVAMMAVQPLLKDVQERHKENPEKQQQELLKIYKEHKVNPLGGCLPLLLPWPVLIALFFAFSKAIELRGAPFLWLPDLAQKDPFYIIPVLMGASMWALSKLSSAGMPPNPQTKMMTVVMPIMMTVLFLNFPSGLNLYYAVSNIVSLPQQYFINKSRKAELAKRQVASPGR